MGALYRIVHEEPPRLAERRLAGAAARVDDDPRPGRALVDGRGSATFLDAGPSAALRAVPAPAPVAVPPTAERTRTDVLPRRSYRRSSRSPRSSRQWDRRVGGARPDRCWSGCSWRSSPASSSGCSGRARTPSRPTRPRATAGPAARRRRSRRPEPSPNGRGHGGLHRHLPRHRHDRPGVRVRDADARVPAGERRARGLPRVLGHDRQRGAAPDPGRPGGADGRLHGRTT